MKFKLKIDNPSDKPDYYFGDEVEFPEWYAVYAASSGSPISITSFEHPDGPFSTGVDVARLYRIASINWPMKGDHNGLTFSEAPTMTLIPY